MTGTATGMQARIPATAAGTAVSVAVTGLRKGFASQPVLTGVDLQIPSGSVTAILGPSGSGKTTLLRLLAGFERPDAGTITIGGTLVAGPARHVPPETRRVGYVPQEGSLFPHLDVKANIGFGLPRQRRRGRVAELLETTGLSELADRFPHQLSGGQQQRVALARALAPEPSLMLLDEPFSSLDAFLRASVRSEVARILGEAGTTTVIVTHDQDEALSIADQVAVLRDGHIAQTGSPQEIYTRPADAALAGFLGEANLVAGTTRAGRAETAFGSVPLANGLPDFPDGTAVVALVRPEQIQFASSSEPGTVTGVVVRCDYHGHDAVLAVDVGGNMQPRKIIVRCPAPAAAPHTALSPGAAVALRAVGAVTAWPHQ